MATQTACPGTLSYMPPEALEESPKYDKPLDIFSFGQLSLYVAVQQFPQVFNVTSSPGVVSAIRNGELEFLRRKKWIDMLSKDYCLLSVITQCLQDKMEKRPDARKLNGTMKILGVKNTKTLEDVTLAWRHQVQCALLCTCIVYIILHFPN